MPTGYTAEIYHGRPVSLRDFAFGCARAFGALAHMRDAPMDAPIPAKVEPDTAYHEEQLRVAQARLDHLLALDDTGIATECAVHNQEQWARYEEHRLETERLRAAYDNMLVEVRSHPFPTELETLRNFMIQQLECALEYDCHDRSFPVPVAPAAFRTMMLGDVRHDIDYHNKEIGREIDRAARCNAWLQSLRASFPEVP